MGVFGFLAIAYMVETFIVAEPLLNGKPRPFLNVKSWVSKRQIVAARDAPTPGRVWLLILDSRRGHARIGDTPAI
jgi:hypothetical protein